MRFYKVLSCRFCEFCEMKLCKIKFYKARFCVAFVFFAVLLFMPLSAIKSNDFAKDFGQSSTNSMASISANDFASDFGALFEPKLQREYRILSVFGKQELELHIQAILNSKVLIHDKWYKVGDKIGAYHIYAITQNSITLIDKKSSQKTLRLKTKDNQQPHQNPRQNQLSSQAFSQENSLKSKAISSNTKGAQ